jgi:peptidylprolyl isomerase
MAENSCTVKKGDYLLIDYAAKFEDGTVFDITSKEKSLKAGTYDTEKEYRPLFCRVDMGRFMKGIDKGVLGIACPRTCKANLNYR